MKKTKLPDTNEKVQIEVCGQTVVESRSEKLLGLIVNTQLTW